MKQYLLIWAVGSILGVTKAVDMKFTNKFDVCRLQVLVLDPNLIPQFVDIVIGDHLYELQFRVEENVDSDNPVLMDMDDEGFGDDEPYGADGNGPVPQDKEGGTRKKNDLASSSTSKIGGDGQNGRQVLEAVLQEQYVPADTVTRSHRDQISCGVVSRSPISRGSTSNSLGTVSREMAVVLTPKASMLVAVPESLLGNAVSKRSKRRANLSTGDSIERATKLKAARNLDKSFTEGTQHVAPSCFLPSEKILSNLRHIGFKFSDCSSDLQKFVDFLSNSVNSCALVPSDTNVIDRAIAKEEKEFYEEKELEKFMLSSLCSDILEEVMDTTSEQFIRARTAVSHKKKRKGRKKSRSVSK